MPASKVPNSHTAWLASRVDNRHAGPTFDGGSTSPLPFPHPLAQRRFIAQLRVPNLFSSDPTPIPLLMRLMSSAAVADPSSEGAVKSMGETQFKSMGKTHRPSHFDGHSHRITHRTGQIQPLPFASILCTDRERYRYSSI